MKKIPAYLVLSRHDILHALKVMDLGRDTENMRMGDCVIVEGHFSKLSFDKGQMSLGNIRKP